MADPARDRALGQALSALEVPAHRLGFWEALDDRLIEDRMARRASSPSLDTVTPPAAEHDRAQDEFVELARPIAQLSGRRRAPRNGRWLTPAAAVVAVVVLAAGALALRPDDEARPQQVATVGEVTSRLSATLAGITAIGGTLTETMSRTEGPPVVVTSTFVRRADGSFRLTAVDGSRDIAYDAPSGVRRELASLPDGSMQAFEERGMPLGFPDIGAPGFVFADDLGTILRALDDTSRATLDDLDADGRPAWVIETPISPDLLGGPESPDRVRLVIDKATVTPLAYTFLAGDKAVLEVAVADLVVDAPIDPATFTLPLPEGADVDNPIDYGFRRVDSPSEASSIAGYDATVPAVVPEGFELVEVAVASEAGPTGAEAANPTSIDVIALSYRRGFEQIVVSTRRAEDTGGYGWSDPFGTEGVVLDADERVLEGGRFAGTTVELATTPPVLPHLWGESPELVFTVSGSLDREELMAVAESLS